MLVLLCDDNLGILRSVRRQLTGYRAIVASDEESAVRLIAQAKPQILITDIILSNGNGLELISRAREQRPALKIVGMSGFPGLEIADSVIAAGADCFLAKEDLSKLPQYLSALATGWSAGRER